MSEEKTEPIKPLKIGPFKGYRTVSSRNEQDLATNVSEWIELGWKPVGGLAVYADGIGKIFYQAMWLSPTTTARSRTWPDRDKCVPRSKV